MDILDQLLEPEAPIPSVIRTPSPLQEAIFSTFESTKDNLLIEAVAGSGKTTTVMELVRRFPSSHVYIAFNRDIVTETKLKYPFCNASTFHAFGNGMWKQFRKGSRLDKNKLTSILLNAVGRDSRIYKDFYSVIPRIVSLAKNQAWGLGTMKETALDFEGLICNGQFDVPAEDIQTVSEVACTVFHRSIADLNTYDFDDQIYIPVKLGWVFPFYAVVFVDECQDLNPLQHIMLQRLFDIGARIIAVGDRRQAIYAFRGALSSSMDLLAHRFDMRELPLSVTYRCPLSVVREAQAICPHIEPKPGALEGKVIWRDDEALDSEVLGDSAGASFAADPELFTQYQLVLCRNNAPLFAAILRHVRARSPCRVKSNFFDGFKSFIKNFKEDTTIGLLLKLDDWIVKEKAAALARGLRSKVASLEDKYQTVKLLASEFDFTYEVLDCVEGLQNSSSGPTFSTIHKAKGLEAPHVYLIRPDLIPAFYAETEEQKVQEMNLKYVGITRAQETFTYGVIE